MAAKDREPVQLWSNQLPTISQRTTTDFSRDKQSDNLTGSRRWITGPYEILAVRTDDIRELWSQPAFALTPYYIVLRGEATNTKFIVSSLAQPCLEPMITHIQGEHANNYTTDQVVE